MKQTRAVIWGLFILFGLLIVSACHLATPCPSRSPTATPSPPTVDAPSPGPSRTAVPTATSTRSSSTPSPDLSRALRAPFRGHEDQFPDATRYDLELTVDLEAVTVSGHEEIGYRNTEGVTLHALYLRLFPNTPGYGGRMTVTNLSLDGQLVAPVTELESSALRVPLHPPLRPDARVRLTVDFTVALPTDRHPAESRVRGGGYRQLGYYEETVTLPNVYPVVPVYDEGWNVELAPAYGDAVFSDVAFFNVRISAPATMTLAASGTCAPYATHGGTKSWSCIAGPMRDFNAILREGYEVKSRGVRGITVNSVFYAEHEAGGSRALDYASRAVRLFDRGIGPYPFTELDVVETPTLAGGIEYPGLVVINSSYYEDGSTRMEWVVVHEVLHQWWYGLVGNDQVDEPWLDEALVQYCTLLYFQEYHGQAVADRLLETVFRQPYAELQETGRDQPVGLPVAAYSRGDYGPLIYQKGPLYFHDVRQAVGDEAFREILKTYFEGNRYGIATPDDWLTAVEAVAGRQYRDLFDGWIGAQ